MTVITETTYFIILMFDLLGLIVLLSKGYKFLVLPLLGFDRVSFLSHYKKRDFEFSFHN